MDRRTFLSMAAASPFVFGLQDLLAQESAPADPKPEWLQAALGRMKETRRYGVVLVIPPGKKGQVRLGQGILARLSSPGLQANELFCEVVFICLSEKLAEQFRGGTREGDRAILDGVDRILLDPDGKKVAADRIDLKELEHYWSFHKTFGRFVHGENGERLAAHQKEIEKTLPVEVLEAAARLTAVRTRPESDDDRMLRRKDMDLLRSRADQFAPWMTRHSELIGGGPFCVVLWEYFLDQSELEPEHLLPYGIQVERFQRRAGCGESVSCGRARIRLTDYRFLEYLAK